MIGWVMFVIVYGNLKEGFNFVVFGLDILEVLNYNDKFG